MPITVLEAHEIRHRRTEEFRARRGGVFIHVHIPHDDVAIGIDIIAVEIRPVGRVFLRDGECARWRIVAFTPGGNRGNTREFSALVKVGALRSEIDLDVRRPG
jgi:hypothetical protein